MAQHLWAGKTKRGHRRRRRPAHSQPPPPPTARARGVNLADLSSTRRHGAAGASLLIRFPQKTTRGTATAGAACLAARCGSTHSWLPPSPKPARRARRGAPRSGRRRRRATCRPAPAAAPPPPRSPTCPPAPTAPAARRAVSIPATPLCAPPPTPTLPVVPTSKEKRGIKERELEGAEKCIWRRF